MEMVFATIIGCLLSFLCGAGVVYGRDLLKPTRDLEAAPEDENLKSQWVKFLNYDGNERSE